MLDALLADECKDPDQYDENYGVAYLDCFIADLVSEK